MWLFDECCISHDMRHIITRNLISSIDVKHLKGNSRVELLITCQFALDLLNLDDLYCYFLLEHDHKGKQLTYQTIDGSVVIEIHKIITKQ